MSWTTGDDLAFIREGFLKAPAIQMVHFSEVVCWDCVWKQVVKDGLSNRKPGIQ